MRNNIPHTVYLQDGSLCNFRKRIFKKAKPLISCLSAITDPRKKRGIRYDLSLMLFLLFAAMTTGCTTLKDAHLWALYNKRFLGRHFLLLHGLPDPTTISILLAKLNPDEVVKAYTLFMRFLGIELGDVVSFDGKTMRAVSAKDSIRHILSLFSHLTHTVRGQIGVTQKENEIPAFRRLLESLSGGLTGCLFVADALHAQKETAKAILKAQADYLLVIKGNQEDFAADIQTAFTEQKDLPGANYQKQGIVATSFRQEQVSRKRNITTSVTTTHDQSLCEYLTREHGFAGLKTVGLLKRSGTRTSKDGTVTKVSETVCFVSSRRLSAKQAGILLRSHWCIENNLHWVKDFVFLEDRQTLRAGNAPQIMSFLRSMCISIFNLLELKSISDAIHNFAKSKTVHYQFLKMAAIV